MASYALCWALSEGLSLGGVKAGWALGEGRQRAEQRVGRGGWAEMWRCLLTLRECSEEEQTGGGDPHVSLREKRGVRQGQEDSVPPAAGLLVALRKWPALPFLGLFSLQNEAL